MVVDVKMVFVIWLLSLFVKKVGGEMMVIVGIAMGFVKIRVTGEVFE